ncbi:hypothetical protein A6R68_13976 [Neotoma lepida]|uniref:Uncharacterized protein n=1 Tax=Neotoma lepida TaxID=56216 RepID=A0A1A6HAY3_NEOLE|nr:hypothetical protein A6R68_13976 [Neotoma lepida]
MTSIALLPSLASAQRPESLFVCLLSERKAVGALKVVIVFSVADGYSENNVFYGHHAKIVCLAWLPDNEHFASSGMDMMVYVWTLSDPETKVKIQDAHWLHRVSSLAWLDKHTLVTTSHDVSVKEWTITY